VASFNPQVGDIGLEIVVDLQTCDCNGNVIPFDVSGALSMEICLRKPDQLTTTHYTAAFSTCGTGDGTDGSISYKTISASDLDVAGKWCVSAKITFPDGRVFRGGTQCITVEQPVCS